MVDWILGRVFASGNAELFTHSLDVAQNTKWRITSIKFACDTLVSICLFLYGGLYKMSTINVFRNFINELHSEYYCRDDGPILIAVFQDLLDVNSTWIVNNSPLLFMSVMCYILNNLSVYYLKFYLTTVSYLKLEIESKDFCHQSHDKFLVFSNRFVSSMISIEKKIFVIPFVFPMLVDGIRIVDILLNSLQTLCLGKLFHLFYNLSFHFHCSLRAMPIILLISRVNSFETRKLTTHSLER